MFAKRSMWLHFPLIRSEPWDPVNVRHVLPADHLYADAMSATRWLDEEEQRTWRAYIQTSHLLRGALERQLQRDSGIPHAYYMILVALSESPGRTMTMTELADFLDYSASRLSHAVARLEEKGWACRT